MTEQGLLTYATVYPLLAGMHSATGTSSAKAQAHTNCRPRNITGKSFPWSRKRAAFAQPDPAQLASSPSI